MKRRRLLLYGAIPAGLMLTGAAAGAEIQSVLLGLSIMLFAAKIGGDLFERMGQPSVLGELLVGIVMGNLTLFGVQYFEPLATDKILETLAELGVIILLFQVGLESTVREMLSVGKTALFVAVLGVVAPFGLGYGVSALMRPDESVYLHIFIGAVLCATSVGITARVLQDLGKSKTREAKIIIGAAVIDDVLGLVVLSAVVALVAAANAGTGGVSALAIAWIVGKALLFLAGAIVVGGYLFPRFFRFGMQLKSSGVVLAFALLLCFLLSWIAAQVGLAPIVGAFAAGLILEDVHFKGYEDRGEQPLEHLLAPIAWFLTPLFFVRMGMLVDISTFAQIEILGFALVLTAAAIIGKQACSLGVWDRLTDRLTIGLGMIPRGEVGLIFAAIGTTLMYQGSAVISPAKFSAVVIMVVITTVVTPPLLKWSLGRRKIVEAVD